MSPTVLEAGGFRFFFYSREAAGGVLEPPHVHVQRGGSEAKVWLEGCEVVYGHGSSAGERRTLRRLVEENHTLLRNA